MYAGFSVQGVWQMFAGPSFDGLDKIFLFDAIKFGLIFQKFELK